MNVREERRLLAEQNKAKKLELQAQKMAIMQERNNVQLACYKQRQEDNRKLRKQQQQTQNDLMKALLGRLNKE